MEQLIPGVQRYHWGSVDALPSLLGVEPDGEPWAELWVGDHPRLPSTVAATGNPLAADLPFLLKLLTADQPLSIQCHPSLDQALAGFARENEAGVALDAPNRTYRDANHKPELVCALTPFEVLCGFREPKQIAADFAPHPALAEIAELLVGDDGLRNAFRWLVTRSAEESADLVSSVAPSFPLTARLDELYPGDIGAIVALLLNHIVLEPGQAIFLEAGNVHAYLGGVAVEIMANSDNVIRGGLTSKFIDTSELSAVVDFRPLDPRVQQVTQPIHRFDSPVRDFSLTRIELGAAPPNGVLDDAESGFGIRGPELVLVSEGAIEIEVSADCDRGKKLRLAAGQAAFLVPADERFHLTNLGPTPAVAWRATVGH